MKHIYSKIIFLLFSILIIIVSVSAIENLFTTRNFLGRINMRSKNGTSANTTNSNSTAGNDTRPKQVTAPPYQIHQCDQVLEIEGQNLTDIIDFKKKSPAFFTMSVFMVNMFDKKDVNTLRKSISFDNIVTIPAYIPGSVSCLSFSDTTNQIAMCLPNKETAMNILKTFNEYMKCRIGDNLTKNTPAATLTKILSASCLGLDVKLDIDQYGGDVNKAHAALQQAMNIAMTNVAKNLKDAVQETKATDPIKVIDGKEKP